MKRKYIKFGIFPIAIAVVISFLIITKAHAGLDVGIETVAVNTGLGTTDLRTMVANVIKVAIGFLGIIAVGIVIYGGFLYMTAGGEEGNVQKAQLLLKNGAIGLLIIFASYGITLFIFSLFGIGPNQFAGFRFNAPGDPGYEAGSGALGNGIIQSHFPPRNAKDVPRNTSIVITFKEKVAIDMIIDCPGEQIICPAGVLQTSSIGAFEFRSQEINSGAKLIEIDVSTPDQGKTFIFTPKQYLGSPDFNSQYAVLISRGLKKALGGNAFAPNATNPIGYSWQFEVSTKLDLEPPSVVSILPGFTNIPTQKTDRNHIIQINFSEPINPSTISGIAPGFNNIETSIVSTPDDFDSDAPLAGTYSYSNNYKTVEFVTNKLCGKNSCGNNVFCLPEDEQLAVLVKSSTLVGDANAPFRAAVEGTGYTGVVDMAANSLDGNKNKIADGSITNTLLPSAPYYENYPEYGADFLKTSFISILVKGGDATHKLLDDYRWSFFTNNIIDLEPPQIDEYSPIANAEQIDPRDKAVATFSKVLSSSTIKPGTNYGDGACSCDRPSDCKADERCSLFKGYCVKDNTEEATGVRVSCVNYQPTDCVTAREEVLSRYGKETIEVKDVCIQPEFLTLDQDKAAEEFDQTWYQVSRQNNQPSSDLNTHYSDTDIYHGLLLENSSYGIRYGSGVQDIKQNCYAPNAAPGCQRVEVPGKVGEYNADSDWAGTFPSCDLTNSSFGSIGEYTVSFINEKGVNEIKNISAFSWNIQPSAGELLVGELISKKFSFLESLNTLDTINYSLYHEQIAETPGKYYLIASGNSSIPRTKLAKTVSVGDEIIELTSVTDLLDTGGDIFIKGKRISYTEIDKEKKTIKGFTDLGLTGSEVYAKDTEVLIAVPQEYEIEYGTLPTATETDALIEPIIFSGANDYSATLSWAGVVGDTYSYLVHNISDGSDKLNFIIDPGTSKLGAKRVRVVHPGGVIIIDGTKPFSIQQK